MMADETVSDELLSLFCKRRVLLLVAITGVPFLSVLTAQWLFNDI